MAIRLHAFASSKGWLLAFERLLYARKTRIYQGQCDGFVGSLPGSEDDVDVEDVLSGFRYPIEVLKPDGSWSFEIADHSDLLVNQFNFVARISGVEHHCAHNEQEYKELNVLDPGSFPDQRTSRAVAVLRMLNRRLGDLLFAKPHEILALLKPQNRGYSHLLSLAEYHHPPRLGLSTPVLPSETETFREIAAVLAYRDPKRFRVNEPQNTSWDKWPFSVEA